MVMAAVGSGGYDLLLSLHVLSVIVGFGGVMLNGVYLARAVQVGGREGLAVSRANAEVTRVCEFVMYTIPVWGIVLVIASGKVRGGKFLYDFGKPWVGAGFVIYIVIVGLHHGLLRPTHRRITEALTKGTRPDASVLSRASVAGALTDLLVVAAVALMIWKPGQ